MDVADWSPNPQELYSAVEFRKILIKCLLRLQPTLRIVFVLRDIEELSINETGEALGLSAVAIRARLFRARLQLRERLSRYFKTRDGDLPAVALPGKVSTFESRFKWATGGGSPIVASPCSKVLFLEMSSPPRESVLRSHEIQSKS